MLLELLKKDILKTIKIPNYIFVKYNLDKVNFQFDSDLHGKLHEYRVLIFAYLIGIMENANIDLLCNAAKYHDTWRFDDGYDMDHGIRAFDWLKENDFDEELCYIVKWHVPDDKFIPKMTLNLKCFKDADALDRWRINDLNISYLRTDSSKLLVEFAKKLNDLTKNGDSNNDPKETIINALIKLDMLK